MEVAPSYSVLIPDKTPLSGPGRRQLNVLYRGTTAIARSSDVVTVGRALLSELEAILSPGRGDAIFLDATLLTNGSVHALICPDHDINMLSLERRLKGTKLYQIGGRPVRIDKETGSLLPPQPALRIDPDALYALGRADAIVPEAAAGDLDRSVTLDAVVFVGHGQQISHPISHAQALHHLASRAMNLRMVGGKRLSALALLVQRAQGAEVVGPHLSGIVREIFEVLRRTEASER